MSKIIAKTTDLLALTTPKRTDLNRSLLYNRVHSLNNRFITSDMVSYFKPFWVSFKIFFVQNNFGWHFDWYFLLKLFEFTVICCCSFFKQCSIYESKSVVRFKANHHLIKMCVASFSWSVSKWGRILLCPRSNMLLKTSSFDRQCHFYLSRFYSNGKLNLNVEGRLNYSLIPYRMFCT